MDKSENKRMKRLTLKLFFVSIDYEWIRTISESIQEFKKTSYKNQSDMDDLINKPYSHSWVIEDLEDVINGLDLHLRKTMAALGIADSYTIEITNP